MTYATEDMRLMGGVPGQQLFLYRTADSAATVTANDYFNQAVTEYNLDTGDIIIATTGASNAGSVDVLVATNNGGTVTVASGS